MPHNRSRTAVVPAARDHLDAIVRLAQQAKAYLRRNGVDQWQDDYPARCDFEDDIARGVGFVVLDSMRSSNPVGYAAIGFEAEAEYELLREGWASQRPYGAIHRVMVDDEHKRRGIARTLFEFAEQLCRDRGIIDLRADTAPDNRSMRQLLTRSGFICRGEIVQRGQARLAFDKVLTIE